MKKSIIVFVILLMASLFKAESQVYSIKNGNWNSSSTWSDNNVPTKTSSVVIEHTVELKSISEIKSLHIKKSGILFGDYEMQFWNNGYLIVEGILDIGSIDIKNVGVDFTIESSGEVYLSGDFDAGDLPITCNGSMEISGTITSGTISGEGSITAGDYNVDGTVFGDDAPTGGETYAGQNWTGTGDNKWENPANWSSGIIPSSTTAVRIRKSANKAIISSNAICKSLIIDDSAGITINPGATLKVNGQLTNKAGTGGIHILSNSTATGSIINATDSISAKVERYISGNTSNPYHYICSPINNSDFGAIWKQGDHHVYYYDESNPDPNLDQGWVRKSEGTLMNGRAYAVVGNTNKTFTFEGLMNAKDIEVPVTYTNTTGPFPTGDPQGWNLIGNPYPTAISAAAFIVENNGKLDTSITQAVYFWNDPAGNRNRSDYATRTATTGIHGATDTIGLGQGFFVKVASGVSSLSFSNTQKMVSFGTQFFIPGLHYENLKLAVNGPEGLYNEIAFSFLNDATNQHDALYDAVKLKGNPDIAFYSYIDGSQNIYAIQGRPLLYYSDNIRLGLYAGKSGKYIISISQLENISNDKAIFLIDKVANKMIDLRKGDYIVDLAQGEYNNRFELFLKHEMASNEQVLNDNGIYIDAYSKNDRIYIHQNNNFKGDIIIFDPLGKVLHQLSINKGENTIINLTDYKGFIIIKFDNVDFSKSKKLIVGY